MDTQSKAVWRRWLGVLAACALILTLALTGYALRLSRQLSEPELDKTGSIIGQSVQGDLQRALGYGIPLADLRGVDTWLAKIVDSNPLVSGMAVADTRGQLLAQYGLSAELQASLKGGTPGSQLLELAGQRVRMLPLKAADGSGQAGVLYVAGQVPSANAQVFGETLLLALAMVALAGALSWRIIRSRLARPLARVRESLAGLAEGRIGTPPRPPVTTPVSALQATVASRMHDLSERNRQLAFRIAEVRAAHFDPAILQQLDDLQGRLNRWTWNASSSAPAALTARQARVSTIRRVGLVSLGALLAMLLGVLVVMQARDEAGGRDLVQVSESTLTHAWQATAELTSQRLDDALEGLLADPAAVAALARPEGGALKAVLQRLAPEGGALTLLRTDGSVLASSASRADDVRPGRAILTHLAAGRGGLRGVWQSQSLEYLSGVGRPVSAGGEPAILIATRPLNATLSAVKSRTGIRVALADLRGHAVAEADAEVVQAWREAGRAGFVGVLDGAPVVVSSVVLNDAAGRVLGTLLAQVPHSGALDALELARIVPALLLLALAALGLLFLIPRLLRPVAEGVSRLEQVVAAEGSAKFATAPASLNPARLSHSVDQLEETIEAFHTLRRSRDRQGQRQARFIRHQMTTLASRLGDDARAAILADLDRIEAETVGAARLEPMASGTPLEPHLEQIVDEVGIMALGFQKLADRVGDQYEQLDKLVQELREALRVKTQFVAIQQELEIARMMQLAILPRPFEPRDGLAIAAKMQPAKEIGGDFYDYFPLDEHHIAMTVADVSGKGVPAALFMAVSRTLLRAIAQFSETPAKCIARLNDLLAADNERTMFVTLFYAVIDTRDGSMVYANAGHNPPYILRADGRLEELGTFGGMALAILEGNDYDDQVAKLEPGDRFFMYTDGVTEAFNPQGEMFGVPGLETLLERIRAQPIEEVPAQVVSDVNTFEAGGPQTDDITCLIASWRPTA